MNGAQPVAELVPHLQGFLGSDLANAAEDRRESLAIDGLRRQEAEPVGLSKIVDATDVWMRNLASVAEAFEEVLALRALSWIAASFLQGDRPWTVSSLSEKLHVPERWVGEVIARLVDAKLLVATEDDEAAGYLPARSLETIRVVEVLHALAPNPQIGERCFISVVPGLGRERIESVRAERDAERGEVGRTASGAWGREIGVQGDSVEVVSVT